MTTTFRQLDTAMEHVKQQQPMPTEEIDCHQKNVEWLVKHKPHRVIAFLKTMPPEQFNREVWQRRTAEDTQASYDHMNAECAKYGCD